MGLNSGFAVRKAETVFVASGEVYWFTVAKTSLRKEDVTSLLYVFQ